MTDIFEILYMDETHFRRPRTPEAQLFFLLSGSAEIHLEDWTFTAQPEDVLLINAYESCLLRGTSFRAVVIAFHPRQLSPARAEPSLTPRFDLCSAGNTYNTVYDFTRYCIAHLTDSGSRKEQFYSSRSIFYALYSHLITNFSAPPSRLPQPNQLIRDRLASLTEFMEDHYRESLSLNDTAAAFGLSAPYLASFFKKQTGRSFMEHYNEIRLGHAVEELLAGTDSIEAVALRNGFRDPRAFTAQFRKKYRMLPHVFRKSQEGTPSAGRSESSIPPASLPALTKYLTVFQEETQFARELRENPRIIDAGSLNLRTKGHPLHHHYRNMICVGNAKQFLYAEMQEMLRLVQKEIHFKYVKFHGLLSDGMMVYSEDAYGIPHYSFTLMDKAIDFMLSIDLRPLCQLSFMPAALAEDPSRLIDFYHYNTSPPKDMKKWTGLVTAVTQHLIDRYGEEEVKTWPFCVWNEPDETVDQFSWNDRERFFDFYCQTYRAVKEVCPAIRFGSPSLLISVQKEHGWTGEFLYYTKSHGCPVDFLNIHYYDNSLFEEDAADRFRGEKGYSAINLERSFPLTADPYAFVKFIDHIQDLMRKHQMQHVPVYLTEWNLTISHRDLINDTCFKSCHLIKNLLENYDRLSSYGYWCLTDFEEELQVPAELYHGGLGLFTYNGIPKAHYNAFRLLGRLGDELLSRGNGYFITRKKDSIVILLYNYEHYSKLFAAGFRSNQISTNRYTAFEDMSSAQFALHLTGFSPDTSMVRITERYVNQAAGSSYDAWARMGSRPLETEEDREILMQQSLPGLYLHLEPLTDGALNLHVRMAPLEVRLIEIRRQSPGG